MTSNASRLGGGDEPVAVEGQRSPHLTRSAPGGWSQPRYQHRAEVLWERNAAEEAVVLTEVVGGELPSIEAVLEDAARLASATVERDSGELLDRFGEERSQRDLAADGTAATFQALARAQVDTLPVEERPDDIRTAWFGEAGQSVALDRETLLAAGEIAPAEARLVDVAMRAALLSGANVRVLEPPDPGDPDDQRRPSEGLGALLRFATP